MRGGSEGPLKPAPREGAENKGLEFRPPPRRLPARRVFWIIQPCQSPKGGCRRGRDPLPGPWVGGPRRGGTGKSGQLQHLPRLLSRSRAGWEAWRTPQQAVEPAWGAPGFWGRPWARRDLDLWSQGPGRPTPPRDPPSPLEGSAPWPQACEAASLRWGPGTHLGLVTHTWRCAVCPRVAGRQGAGPGLPGRWWSAGVPQG